MRKRKQTHSEGSSDEQFGSKRVLVESDAHDKEDFHEIDIPVASLKQAPAKKSAQFSVEILLRNYDQQISRDQLYEELTKIEKLEVLVAMEVNETRRTKYRSAIKFKIVLDFEHTIDGKVKSYELYQMMHKILRKLLCEDEQKFSIDDMSSVGLILDKDRIPEIVIIKIHSIKNATYWATEEDFEVRYTTIFNTEFFSIPYKIREWCKDLVQNKKKFDITHPFVIGNKHKKSHNDLKSYFESYAASVHVRHALKPFDLSVLDEFGDWRDECVKWFNAFVEGGWYPKREQLAIIGGPNSGKTLFIKSFLLRGADQEYSVPDEAIYTPERGNKNSINNFAFQSASPAFHAISFLDEFDANSFNIETLKLFLEGSHFNPGKKGTKCDNICMRIPAIFATNYDFPNSVRGESLAARFKIIRIPKNAKKYTIVEENPYAQLFKDYNRKLEAKGTKLTAPALANREMDIILNDPQETTISIATNNVLTVEQNITTRQPESIEFEPNIIFSLPTTSQSISNLLIMSFCEADNLPQNMGQPLVPINPPDEAIDTCLEDLYLNSSNFQEFCRSIENIPMSNTYQEMSTFNNNDSENEINLTQFFIQSFDLHIFKSTYQPIEIS